MTPGIVVVVIVCVFFGALWWIADRAVCGANWSNGGKGR